MNRPARHRPSPSQSRPPRRSLLFVPGDSMHKIEKAVGLDVDSIVMDLEDGVTPGRKEAARETVAEAVRSRDMDVAVETIENHLGEARDDLLGVRSR